MIRIFALACMFICIGNIHASETVDPNNRIEYNLLFNPLDNIEAMSYDMTLVNRSVNEAFEGVFLDNSEENPVFYPWDIYWTYISVVATHEMGHVIRSRQMGGQMNIPATILIPGNTSGHIDTPPNATKDEQHLANLGGFEANATAIFQTEQSIYSHEKAYSDALPSYVIHKMFYPFYVNLLTRPNDPSSLDTWHGSTDPINLAIMSYERMGNTIPRDANGNINAVPPELAKLFDDTNKKSLLIFLDPLFWWSFQGFVSDSKIIDGPPMFHLTDNFSWMYGLHVAPSLFGYETYFTQYMKIYGKNISLYMREANPMKATGWGINAPDIFTTNKLSVGLNYESWNQDTFGKGSSVSMNLRYKLWQDWGLNLKVANKDAGYLLAQPLEKSTYGYAGFTYRFP